MYRYKQNRQLSFLVKRDAKIVNLKVKAHEKEFLFTKFKSLIIRGGMVKLFHGSVCITVLESRFRYV